MHSFGKVRLHRNQFTLKLHNCSILVHSVVEPPDGQEPYLTVSVNKSDKKHEIALSVMQDTLTKLLCAERLLPSHDAGKWKTDQPGKPDRPIETIEELRQYKDSKPEAEWLSIEAASVKTKFNVGSFPKYLSDAAKLRSGCTCQFLRSPQGDFGRTSHGYIWKKSDSGAIQLLLSSLGYINQNPRVHKSKKSK